MSYIILWDTTVPYLVKQVNAFLEKGWKPLGGVSATRYGLHLESTYFYQSMILETVLP